MITGASASAGAGVGASDVGCATDNVCARARCECVHSFYLLFASISGVLCVQSILPPDYRHKVTCYVLHNVCNKNKCIYQKLKPMLRDPFAVVAAAAVAQHRAQQTKT